MSKMSIKNANPFYRDVLLQPLCYDFPDRAKLPNLEAMFSVSGYINKMEKL